jgi:uncharacterized protein
MKRQLWVIEIKRTLASQSSKGFWLACEDLQPDAKLVVYPGNERFPLKNGLEAIGVQELMQLIMALGARR